MITEIQYKTKDSYKTIYETNKEELTKKFLLNVCKQYIRNKVSENDESEEVWTSLTFAEEKLNNIIIKFNVISTLKPEYNETAEFRIWHKIEFPKLPEYTKRS